MYSGAQHHRQESGDHDPVECAGATDAQQPRSASTDVTQVQQVGTDQRAKHTSTERDTGRMCGRQQQRLSTEAALVDGISKSQAHAAIWEAVKQLSTI